MAAELTASRSQSGVRRSARVRDLVGSVREDLKEWVCRPSLLSDSAVKIVQRRSAVVRLQTTRNSPQDATATDDTSHRLNYPSSQEPGE